MISSSSSLSVQSSRFEEWRSIYTCRKYTKIFRKSFMFMCMFQILVMSPQKSVLINATNACYTPEASCSFLCMLLYPSPCLLYASRLWPIKRTALRQSYRALSLFLLLLCQIHHHAYLDHFPLFLSRYVCCSLVLLFLSHSDCYSAFDIFAIWN